MVVAVVDSWFSELSMEYCFSFISLSVVMSFSQLCSHVQHSSTVKTTMVE